MDAVPALGQHTDAILQELGRTPDQIGQLRADGAVWPPRDSAAKDAELRRTAARMSQAKNQPKKREDAL
jgi:hypothetical protein